MNTSAVTCDDIKKCPAQCPVCETCFKMLGCTKNGGGILEKTGTSKSTLFAILAAVGLFLFGSLYYYIRNRHSKDENALKAQLIDKSGGSKKTQLADKNEGFAYELEAASVAGDIPNTRSDLSSLDSDSHTMESKTSSSGHDGYDYSLSADGDMPLAYRVSPTPAGSESTENDRSHTQSSLASVPRIPLNKASPTDERHATGANEYTPPTVTEFSLSKSLTPVSAVVPSESKVEEEESVKTFIGDITDPSATAEVASMAKQQHKAPAAIIAGKNQQADKSSDTTLKGLNRDGSATATTPNSSIVLDKEVSAVSVDAAENKSSNPSNLSAKSRPSIAELAATDSASSAAPDLEDAETESIENGAPYPNPWLDSSILPEEANDVDDDTQSFKSSMSCRVSLDDPNELKQESQPKSGEIGTEALANESRSEIEKQKGICPVLESPKEKMVPTNAEPEASSVLLVPVEEIDETAAASSDEKTVDEEQQGAGSEPAAVWLAPSDAHVDGSQEENDDSSTTSWSPKNNSGPWLAPV